MTSTIGIPIKLLNEAQGHVVTLEITSGQVYRGKLLDAEDNMNVQLKDITVTARDGRVSHLDQVYIRGSHVRFFIVPDMLRAIDLTGSAPDPITTTDSSGSTAGLSHTWPIRTAYYKATIPIWLDEVANPAEWSSDFLLPEAVEVLRVLGAFVVCFRRPVDEEALQAIKTTLEAVSKVAKAACDGAWDGVCLAVAMPQPSTPWLPLETDDWDELCSSYGFEYIDSEATGRNMFGEPTGIARLKEALETNDWAGADEFVEDDEDEDKELDLGLLENGNRGSSDEGFRVEVDELQREMFGMRSAILGEDDDRGEQETEEEKDDSGDLEVRQLEAMMLKLRAVKDMGADLPEAQRKRIAKQAVND
ncbi:MAG: hypothetical protein M1825_006498, partial [Sarcosagium campestre]